jgi:retron-type reverse transcriptase
MLQKWLKAGFMEKHVLYPTEAGTPQGGICSPVLANMALDGLEARLREKFPERANHSHKGKVSLIRYADDVRHLTRCSIPLRERRSSEEMTSGSLSLPGGES